MRTLELRSDCVAEILKSSRALVAPEIQIFTAPGRSGCRIPYPEGTPSLRVLLGGGERVETQCDVVAESLKPMAGLSGVLNGGESSKHSGENLGVKSSG